MQTILGANGQIGVELARELSGEFTQDLRLVSRRPRQVNETDALVSADLLDAEQTREAVAGSEVVYFTAGLPAKDDLWEAQFPVMLRNAIDAARTTGAAFAYFDNTYMYPQDSRVLTEDCPFLPAGPKGRVRAGMATMVLEEIERGDIPVLIARAPEFYGPARTKSFTNSLIIQRMLVGKRPLVPVSADTRRTLIWTPDASRALAALGNTPDAYGQTWHLPVDTSRPTYRELIQTAAVRFGTAATYAVIPKWLLSAATLVSPQARAIRELLPRYAHDNIFDSSKFASRFPEFEVTTFREGLDVIQHESAAAAR